MRWTLDTEFNCSDNKTIDLISIALVSDVVLNKEVVKELKEVYSNDL